MKFRKAYDYFCSVILTLWIMGWDVWNDLPAYKLLVMYAIVLYLSYLLMETAKITAENIDYLRRKK